jgi:uncharacterized Rmd1/YagE family protein
MTEIKSTEFAAQALFVGERIDVRGLESSDRLAVDPLVMRAGDGLAVIFRCGAVVFFDVAPADVKSFLTRLQGRITQPYDGPEGETVRIRIDSEEREAMHDDTVFLHERSIPRLQIVADVLGKSVALAHYESRVAESFQRVEPVAVDLEQRGAGGRCVRELLRHIGGALRDELKMVGRVEVADKPDLTWDHPELERLFVRLEDEFEIRERHRVLERKLQLISHTAQTVLDLLQHRHSLRVEWYIVILIVVEIIIMLYEMLFRGT